jgi:hypothetical protein
LQAEADEAADERADPLAGDDGRPRAGTADAAERVLVPK